MAYLEYQPTSPLFHYTSVNAFKNIATSGRFWLSDLKQSNDPRELEMPKQCVLEAVSRFDRLQLPPEVRQQTSILTFQLIRALKVQRVFTFCLTPNRDSLSEWKEYGSSGNGIAFSIRPRAIRDMHVRVQKVSYVDSNEIDFFDSIVEAQYEKLRYAPHTGLSHFELIEIGTALLSAIYSVKHNSWHLEREVRLTFASSENRRDLNFPVAERPDGSEVHYSTPLRRETLRGSVDYYSIPFGRFQAGDYDISGAFAEIILGPNCIESISDVRSFIDKVGLVDVTISKSECSFTPR